MDDIESKRPESPIGTRYGVSICLIKFLKLQPIQAQWNLDLTSLYVTKFSI